MQPRVILQVGDGRVVELSHGDLVGRLRVCTLAFNDPRISEAHAMVSLRGDALRLLSLRGRFSVDGVVHADVVLSPGQQLSFAPEHAGACTAEVLEVVLPDAVLGLSGAGIPVQALLGTTSIVTAPVPSLRSGVVPEAAGWLSFLDDSWWLQRRGDAAPVAVVPDEAFDIDGLRVVPLLLPLTDANTPATHLHIVAQPLKIVARFHSVHVVREGEAPLLLDGVAARIVSELVLLGGPTAWDVVARDIWKDAPALPVLRGRWDAQLSRLRSRLRAAGIRPDLVRSDRHGFVELVLHPDDVVVDEA
jgi:hypothetical protein